MLASKAQPVPSPEIAGSPIASLKFPLLSKIFTWAPVSGVLAKTSPISHSAAWAAAGIAAVAAIARISPVSRRRLRSRWVRAAAPLAPPLRPVFQPVFMSARPPWFPWFPLLPCRARQAADPITRKAVTVERTSLRVPRGQHARSVVGDRDRELEVGGERAVLRVHRPSVLTH